MIYAQASLNWKKMAEPLVRIGSGEDIGYASLINLYATSPLGNTFYLFYKSGSGGSRYLLRRKVVLTVNPASVSPPQVTPLP